MLPKYWPEGFIYSRESETPGMNPQFFRKLLSSQSPDDSERISTVIEEKRVHPDIEIKIISKDMVLDKTHPLADVKSQKGHIHRGIFATKDIPKGVDLGEYVGEAYLMSMGEFIEVGEQKHSLSEYAWRIVRKDYLYFVDGKRIANELAFINDYKGLQSRPNVIAHWIVHRGLCYFGYSTSCDVRAGDELLADYANDYPHS